MPALVNSSVGSLAGTSDDECTRLWPLLSKKRRKSSRISEPLGIVLILAGTKLTTEARRHGGTCFESAERICPSNRRVSFRCCHRERRPTEFVTEGKSSDLCISASVRS